MRRGETDGPNLQELRQPSPLPTFTTASNHHSAPWRPRSYLEERQHTLKSPDPIVRRDTFSSTETNIPGGKECLGLHFAPTVRGSSLPGAANTLLE